MKAQCLDYSSLFIVGPPRSGTTLLYQLMVHSFHVAYFSNIANRFYAFPVTATKQAHRYCRPYMSDFTSDYGVVEGRMAPHEAGSIWNRWYPTEHYHGYNYTPARYFEDPTKHIIYQTVAGVEQAFGLPFISKNVKHSVRIQSLVEIFPAALFVQIRRNPFDTAMSILRGRKTRNQTLNDWWSVMPKEIEQLRHRNYLEQICGQVFYVERNIEEDMTAVGEDRLHVVSYDDLCRDPGMELARIAAFVGKWGCDLKTKHDIPRCFKRSSHQKSPFDDEEKEISTILQRYYGKLG